MASGPQTPAAALRTRPRTATSRTTNALATPSTSVRRAPSSLLPAQSSASYSSTVRSRQALYGVEGSVVLDLGSRIWKVGFSGEEGPRDCLSVLGMPGGGEQELGIWGLETYAVDEGIWRVREERLKRGLRAVWFDVLQCDPKARKVILVENPLLPTRVKEMIVRVLFENLQVPSLSFASSAMLSLMSIGAVTGLVVDCGHLETTVIPICFSRPLFPNIISTPVAGARLNSRLRSLLLRFGSYAPPPSSLTTRTAPIPTRIPASILTEELLAEMKTRICFAGDTPIDESSRPAPASPEVGMDDYDESLDDRFLDYLEEKLACQSTATTLSFRIPTFSSSIAGNVGRGWIRIPGWVRERAAEVLFEQGDADERSITEAILEALLLVPRDMRKALASSIVVVGGTAMLPGFLPRLREELLQTLSLSLPPSPPPSPPVSESDTATESDGVRMRARLSMKLSILRNTPRYASLAPLSPFLAIVNDPSLPIPVSGSSTPQSSTSPAGQAPGFSPSLLPWIGGSLAGSLKTSGEEITKEVWDAGYQRDGEEEKSAMTLPDWTRVGRLIEP